MNSAALRILVFLVGRSALCVCVDVLESLVPSLGFWVTLCEEKREFWKLTMGIHSGYLFWILSQQSDEVSVWWRQQPEFLHIAVELQPEVPFP